MTELTIEAANRAFLQTWDPLLLNEIKDWAAAGDLLFGTNGPGLRLGDQLFHDPADPSAEARSVVGSSRHGLHLHFGFGLGYFLEADQPAAKGLTLIYEPNPGFVQLALQHIPLEGLLRRTQATLCCSFERFRYLFLKYYGCYGSNRLFISRPHTRVFSEAFLPFQELIDRQSSELVVKSANRLFPTVLASTLASLPDHVRSPGCEHWRNHLKGKPAVIIGAGPSLERNIDQLIPKRDSILIFAVARVTALLENLGIRPDFLAHVEAQDFRNFIEGRGNLAQTSFLLADQAHPFYYQFPHGQTYVFQSRTNPIINSLVARFPQLRHEVIKTGGSVATAAFYLAFLAGCDPIILIGQDLALAGTRCYAGGDPDQKDGEMRRTVPGYYGGQVQTLANYHNNIIWYEKALPTLRQLDPQRRFINATEGGALLRGMEMQSLAHVLQDLPSGKISLDQPDCSAHRPLAPEQLQCFFEELAGFLGGMETVRADFHNAEQQVLQQLSLPQPELTQDPNPHLAGLLSVLEKTEHFNELCKGEFALTKLLALRQKNHPAKSAQDRTRIWAGLAAIHQGLRDLDLLANSQIPL